jgi:hypothetical protein
MANHQQIFVACCRKKPPVFVCIVGHHKPRLGLSLQVRILKKALKGYYNLQWAVLPD